MNWRPRRATVALAAPGLAAAWPWPPLAWPRPGATNACIICACGHPAASTDAPWGPAHLCWRWWHICPGERPPANTDGAPASTDAYLCWQGVAGGRETRQQRCAIAASTNTSCTSDTFNTGCCYHLLLKCLHKCY